MGILTWIVVAVVILAIIGLGAGTFFSGVMRGVEVAANNTLVQNATDQARDFVEEKVKSGIDDVTGSKDKGDSSLLELTTGKPTYKQGEPVTFIIKNNADKALAFPNSAFGLEITNTDTGEALPIFSAQVITSIEPGQSKSITLTLEGADGQLAGPGNYLAKVHITPRDDASTAQVDFIIAPE
jgi:type II secretory pathway pseudopilin PulG